MSRAEALKWCKDRALAEFPDLGNALASFVSDLGKHECLKSVLQLATDPMFGLLGMQAVMKGDSGGLKSWIEGFN